MKKKKISKTHQSEMIDRMKKLGYGESEIKQLMNDDSLFAGTKSKSQSITFKGTDMTIGKPTLTIRSRGNKNTRALYNNVMTDDLMNARKEYDVRTEDIYEDVARKWSLTHNFGTK